ncbi:MAG: 1,6-anhydro-N-acetylmuramyl-L-alanine amidase AmpD [Magnetococcales bacterium]|nr:1,6-anhydro-N-acetylmuramyl-L-alanine amidase AmpD [Magnetococcales bacterium]
MSGSDHDLENGHRADAERAYSPGSCRGERSLSGFRYLPSPHADDRPAGSRLDLVVVHAISLPPGEFAVHRVDELFLGRLDPEAHPYFREIAGLRVSAHFLVARCGDVTQYVPVQRRAWHAGASQWRGRSSCNDFSVGIELSGDEVTPFTPAQYLTLARLQRTLKKRHPSLHDDHVAGHQHIAPGRKWDPGPCFDWDFFKECLAKATPDDHWPIVWK